MNSKAVGAAGKYAPPVHEFSPVVELLAAVRDEIAHLNTNFISANSKKGHRPKPPKPWPRPEIARDRVKHRRQVADIVDIVGAVTPLAAEQIKRALRAEPDD